MGSPEYPIFLHKTNQNLLMYEVYIISTTTEENTAHWKTENSGNQKKFTADSEIH